MKISSYNQLIAMFTFVAGLVVFSLLWYKYQEVEGLVFHHSESRLALKSIEHFATMSQTWLTTQDLFFSGKQSYLAQGIETQAQLLIQTAQQIQQQNLSSADKTLVTALVTYIEGNTELIKTLATNVEQPEAQWLKTISLSDQISYEFIAQLEAIAGKLQESERQLAYDLQQASNHIHTWIWCSCMGYLLCIMLGTHWVSKHIIEPIENIMKIANQPESSIHHIEFRQVNAPKEIIKLAESIQAFAQHIKVEQINAETARLNANEANNRITAIMNSVPTAIVLLDKNGFIKEFNRETIRLFQCESSDIIHSEIWRFLPVLQTIKGEFDVDFVLKTAEESLLSPEIDAPYVEYSGRTLAILGEQHYLLTISDINERKHDQRALSQLHEQLINTEKMASIGQLAAGIAHEINNPVGYIRSNIDILTDYSEQLINYIRLVRDPSKNDEAEAYFLAQDFTFILSDIKPLVESSQEGVARITQIIRDLGNYAHVDEKQTEMLVVDKLLAQSLALVTNELKYKVEIVTDLNASCEIAGFPQKLIQVFINLLVNASHAIEVKGKIWITTLATDNEVKIIIKDNGAGIASSHLNTIFDPFFTTKPVGKGTGLGLHIVRSIIEEHNGHINVTSAVGQGSKFSIYLPLGAVS